MSDYLPHTPGLLPKWQLFVTVVALLNTVQSFVSPKIARLIYTRVPPSNITQLQSRIYGIWTLTSSVVRFYAAYNITEKPVYDLALFTYLIAFGHFASELFIFRTAKVSPGILSPLVFASLSLIWMIKQYDFYVKS